MPTRPPASQPHQTEESTVRQMMQKLESMEHASEGNTHQGHNRWMVPYADLLTLLLGLFLVLFTASQKPEIAQTGLERTKHAPSATQTAIIANAGAQTDQPPQTQQHTEQARDMALARQLKQTIGAKMPMQGIEIRQQERGVVISLKDSILFTAGNADLSPAARHTLDGLIQQLHAALGGQSRPIRVEGHTDNSPIATSKYPSNWELSTARATTIVRFLVASHHFQPQLLSAAGYGEFKPVKDNSSIEGKQKNRRVDIVVLKPDLAQQEPPALNDPTAPKNGRAEIHVED
jgi:chemotaxis protein MotB